MAQVFYRSLRFFILVLSIGSLSAEPYAFVQQSFLWLQKHKKALGFSALGLGTLGICAGILLYSHWKYQPKRRPRLKAAGLPIDTNQAFSLKNEEPKPQEPIKLTGTAIVSKPEQPQKQQPLEDLRKQEEERRLPETREPVKPNNAVIVPKPEQTQEQLPPEDLLGLQQQNLLLAQKLRDLDIIIAVKKGDYEATNRLIMEGANINAIDGSGNTPLHIAVEKDSLQLVKLLVQKGAGLEAKNRLGDTPLFEACAAGGKFEIAQFLVSKGADLSPTNCLTTNFTGSNSSTLFTFHARNWEELKRMKLSLSDMRTKNLFSMFLNTGALRTPANLVFFLLRPGLAPTIIENIKDDKKLCARVFEEFTSYTNNNREYYDAVLITNIKEQLAPSATKNKLFESVQNQRLTEVTFDFNSDYLFS